MVGFFFKDTATTGIYTLSLHDALPISRVLDVTRGVVRLQSGYLYHYAFAMLLGVAALATYFMFGGAH